MVGFDKVALYMAPAIVLFFLGLLVCRLAEFISRKRKGHRGKKEE